MGSGAYLVGVAFWMFIGAVSIAGLIADHQKRRLNVDFLRTIIDKGQSIDPALAAKLLSPDAIEQRTDPMDLKLGGIITTSAGIGLAFVSYFIAQIAPAAFYPILAGSAITICVGVGLLVGAKTLASARLRERTNPSSP